jgi:hypothetical protein
MGFWSKLGKIASFAAPIVAAPFTGGATLALIGAGAGAAGGAMGKGGWKGALTGGALGAIPGLGKMGKLGSVGSKVFGGGAGAGASKLGNVNAVTDGVKEVAQKGLGGKLLDSLTSPEMLKAGIGAGLSGIFGEDEGPQKRKSYKGSADPQKMMEQLQQILSASGRARIDLLGQPFQAPTMAPINFNPEIKGLPFKLGLNTPGSAPSAPTGQADPLAELRKLLGGL